MKDAADVAARRVAMIQRGWLPIPLYANKNPALNGWPEVVADEATVRNDTWWREHPNTGAITKHAPVIDVDIKDQTAADAIEQLICERHGTAGRLLRRVGNPPKFAVPFRTDEPFKKLTLKLRAPDGEVHKKVHKIEILCDGQHTVVDGIHPETKLPYEWSGGEPWSVARDELPLLTRTEAEAFLAAARDQLFSQLGWWEDKRHEDDASPSKGASDDWVPLQANIIAGNSLHDSLRDLAAKMIVAGMKGGAVTNSLRGLMEASAAPRDERWRERFDDIPRAVMTAEAKFGPHAKGALASNAAKKGKEKAGAKIEPTPLFPPLPPAEIFPTQALGGILAKAAFAIARKIQVPESIAAQSVLAAAALTAQAMADVRLPYGQDRPLSLYFATVASSGDRKTSSDTEALWPIRRREVLLGEIYRAEHEQWSMEHAAWAAERKKIEGNKKLNYDQVKISLHELGPAPAPPLHAFLTAPDPTVEGLIKAWISAPASLGLFSAEGGQFIGGHGMNQENRLKTAAAFSEIWDGRTIKRLRASDGVTILRGRRLSMHMMVQPDAAAAFLSDPVLRNQGLLSRILVAGPDSIIGTRLYRDTEPGDETIIRAYGAHLLSILESPWPLADGQRNELAPPCLELAEDAAADWKEFYNRVERLSGANNQFGVIADFAAKAAENAARIAGVLTVVADPGAVLIDAGGMGNAIVLMDWYVKETLRLQRAARTDPRLLRAQRLLEWLQANGPEIEVLKILRFGPASERNKAALDETLAALLSHGWVRVLSKRPQRIAVVPAG